MAMETSTNSSPEKRAREFKPEFKKVQIPDRIYFKIGDVAELVGVKPYVLRYWETEFPMISPQKSNTGQRVYRRTDVETVVLIKTLLYDERYSIEGARKRIRELRKEGELKSFKKEITETPREEMALGELKRAKALAREIKQLAQAPITKLFAF
jgi:DNA-binding transcriptional MerR regulator